jgi:hypothetical protein
LVVAQACGQAHHAVAHVAVQRKVGREGHESGWRILNPMQMILLFRIFVFI